MTHATAFDRPVSARQIDNANAAPAAVPAAAPAPAGNAAPSPSLSSSPSLARTAPANSAAPTLRRARRRGALARSALFAAAALGASAVFEGAWNFAQEYAREYAGAITGGDATGGDATGNAAWGGSQDAGKNARATNATGAAGLSALLDTAAPVAVAADSVLTGRSDHSGGAVDTENIVLSGNNGGSGGPSYILGSGGKSVLAEYFWFDVGGSDFGAFRVDNAVCTATFSSRAIFFTGNSTNGTFTYDGSGSVTNIYSALVTYGAITAANNCITIASEGSDVRTQTMNLYGSGVDFHGDWAITAATNYTINLLDNAAAPTTGYMSGGGSLAGGWDAALGRYAQFVVASGSQATLVFNRSEGSGAEVSYGIDNDGDHRIHASASEGATLTYKRTLAQDYGHITLGYNISGAASVIQRGTGTTTLPGANTYTGVTTIEHGSLILTGTNTGSPTYTVQNESSLILDYANRDSHASATTPIIASSSALSLYGLLEITGGEDDEIKQSFASLTLTGDSSIRLSGASVSSFDISFTGGFNLNSKSLGIFIENPSATATIHVPTSLSGLLSGVTFNGDPAFADNGVLAAANSSKINYGGTSITTDFPSTVLAISSTGSTDSTGIIKVAPATGDSVTVLALKALGTGSAESIPSGGIARLDLNGKTLNTSLLNVEMGAKLDIEDATATSGTGSGSGVLNIPATGTVTVNGTLGLKIDYTLAATLAGAGTLSIKNGARLTLAGNISAFTGGFEFAKTTPTDPASVIVLPANTTVTFNQSVYFSGSGATGSIEKTGGTLNYASAASALNVNLTNAHLNITGEGAAGIINISNTSSTNLTLTTAAGTTVNTITTNNSTINVAGTVNTLTAPNSKITVENTATIGTLTLAGNATLKTAGASTVDHLTLGENSADSTTLEITAKANSYLSTQDTTVNGSLSIDVSAIYNSSLTAGNYTLISSATPITGIDNAALANLPFSAIGNLSLVTSNANQVVLNVNSAPAFKRFTWAAPGTSGNFYTLSNWTSAALDFDQFVVSGVTTAVTKIVIPDNATIRLTGNRDTGYVFSTGSNSWSGDGAALPTQITNNVGLYHNAGGPVTLTGGTIDTGTGNGDNSYAIFVRAMERQLRIESKLTGSGNIAAWHNSNGPSGSGVMNYVGIVIAGDASEWSGTLMAPPNRDIQIDDGAVIGSGAYLKMGGSGYAGARAWFTGNIAFGATVVNNSGTNALWINPGVGRTVTFFGNVGATTLVHQSGTLASFTADNLGTGTLTISANAGLEFLQDGAVFTRALTAAGNFFMRVGTSGYFADASSPLLSYDDTPITVNYSGNFSGNYIVTKTGVGTLNVGTNTTILSATSSLNLAEGTLQFNGIINYNSTKVISGAGRILLTGGSGSDTNCSQLQLNANNASFSGTVETYTHRIWVANASGLGTADIIIHGSQSTGAGQIGFPVAGTYANDFTIEGIGWADAGPTYYGAIRFSVNGDVNLTGDITLTGNAVIGNTGTSGTQRISGNLVVPQDVTLSLAHVSGSTGSTVSGTSRPIYLTGANTNFLGTLALAGSQTHYLGDGSATGRASLPYAAGITVGSGSTLTINNAAASYPAAALAAEAAGATGYDLLAAKYDIIAADITGVGAVTRTTTGGVVYYIGDASGHTHASGFNITAGTIVLGLPEGASEFAAGITPKINTVTVGGSSGATLGTEGGYITKLTVADYGIIKIINAVEATSAVAGEDYTVVTNFTKSGTLQFDVTDFLAAHPSVGTYPVFQVTGTGKPAAGALSSGWQIEAGAGTIRPGTISFAADAAGVVSLVVAATPTLNLTYTGTGGATWSAAGTSNFKNSADGTAQQFYNGDTVTFDNTAGTGSKTVTISGTVKPAAVIVDTPAAGDSYLIQTGVIADYTAAIPTTLTKKGAGTLTLSSANSYTGGTIFTENSGTIIISNNGALGSGPIIFANGSTLQINQENFSAAPLYVPEGVTTALLKQNSSSDWKIGSELVGSGTLRFASNGTAGNWAGSFNRSAGSPNFTGTIEITEPQKFSFRYGDWSQATARFTQTSNNTAANITFENTNDANLRVGTISFVGSGNIYTTYQISVGTIRLEEDGKTDTARNNATTGSANMVYTSNIVDTDPDSPTYGQFALKFDIQETTTGFNFTQTLKSTAGGITNIVKTGPGWLFISGRGNGSANTYSTENTLSGGKFYILEGGVVLSSTSTTLSVVTTGQRNVWDGRDTIIIGESAKLLIATYTWQNDNGGAVNPVMSLRVGKNALFDNYSLNFIGADLTLAGGTIYGHGDAFTGGWGSFVFHNRITVNAIDPVTGTEYIDPDTHAPYTAEKPLVSQIWTTSGANDNTHFGMYGLTYGVFTIDIAENAYLNYAANATNDITNSSNARSLATTLSITGGGTIELSGRFANTGGLSVNDGSTAILSGNLSVMTGNINIGADSTVVFANPNITPQTTGGNLFSTSASTQINTSAQVLLNSGTATLAFDRAGNNITFGNSIIGAGNTEFRAGEITFSSAKLYVGETIIQNGTLKIGLDTAIASSSLVRFTGNSGKFDISTTGSTVAVTKILSTADITGATIALGTKKLQVPEGEFYGSFTSTSGTATIEKTSTGTSSAGTLRIGGKSPAFNGTFNIVAGTVSVAQTNALGTGTLVFNSGATNALATTLIFTGIPDGSAGATDTFDFSNATGVTINGTNSIVNLVFQDAGKKILFGNVSGTSATSSTIKFADGSFGIGSFAGTVDASATSTNGTANLLLKTGATLAVAKSIKSIELFGGGDTVARNATITNFNGGAFSNVAYTVRLVSSGINDKITLGGTPTIGTGNTITLSPWTAGNYNVLSTISDISSSFAETDFTILRSNAASSARETTRIWLADNKNIWLGAGFLETKLEWNGTSIAWNTTASNTAWLGLEGNAPTAFSEQDSVTFSDLDSGTTNVAIPTNHTVGALTLTHDGSAKGDAIPYSFYSSADGGNATVTITGNISATYATETAAWQTNTFSAAAGAKATFAQNVNLNFANFIITGEDETAAGTDPTAAVATTISFFGNITARDSSANNAGGLAVTGGANVTIAGGLDAGTGGVSVSGIGSVSNTPSILRITTTDADDAPTVSALGSGFSVSNGAQLIISSGALSSQSITIAAGDVSNLPGTLVAETSANNPAIVLKQTGNNATFTLSGPAGDNASAADAAQIQVLDTGANADTPAANSLEIQRTITGGRLLKTGLGVLILTPQTTTGIPTQNSFGGLTIGAGSVQVSNVAALGTTTTSIGSNDATVGIIEFDAGAAPANPNSRATLIYARPVDSTGKLLDGAILDLSSPERTVYDGMNPVQYARVSVTAGTTARFDTGAPATNSAFDGIPDTGAADSGTVIELGLAQVASGAVLENIGAGTVRIGGDGFTIPGTLSQGKWEIANKTTVAKLDQNTKYFISGDSATPGTGSVTINDGFSAADSTENLASGVTFGIRAVTGGASDIFLVSATDPLKFDTSRDNDGALINPVKINLLANAWGDIAGSTFTVIGGNIDNSWTDQPLTQENIYFNGIPLNAHSGAAVSFSASEIKVQTSNKNAALTWLGGADGFDNTPLVWETAQSTQPWEGKSSDGSLRPNYFVNGDLISFSKTADDGVTARSIKINAAGETDTRLIVSALNITAGGYTFFGDGLLGDPLNDASAITFELWDGITGTNPAHGKLVIKDTLDSDDTAPVTFFNSAQFASVEIDNSHLILGALAANPLAPNSPAGTAAFSTPSAEVIVKNSAILQINAYLDTGSTVAPTFSADAIALDDATFTLNSTDAVIVNFSTPIHLAGTSSTNTINIAGNAAATLTLGTGFFGNTDLTKTGPGTLALTTAAQDDDNDNSALFAQTVNLVAGSIKLLDAAGLGFATLNFAAKDALLLPFTSSILHVNLVSKESGYGTVRITTDQGNSPVTLTLGSVTSSLTSETHAADNSAFSGKFEISAGATLKLTSDQHLDLLGDAALVFGSAGQLPLLPTGGTLDLSALGTNEFNLGSLSSSSKVRQLTAIGLGARIIIADGGSLLFGGSFVSGDFTFLKEYSTTNGTLLDTSYITLTGNNASFGGNNDDKITFGDVGSSLKPNGENLEVSLESATALGSAPVVIGKGVILIDNVAGDPVAFKNKFSGEGKIVINGKTAEFQNTATDLASSAIVSLENGATLILSGATLGAAAIHTGSGSVGGDTIIASAGGNAGNSLVLGTHGVKIEILDGETLNIIGTVAGDGTITAGLYTPPSETPATDSSNTLRLSGDASAHTGDIVIESGVLEIAAKNDAVPGRGLASTLTLGDAATPVTFRTVDSGDAFGNNAFSFPATLRTIVGDDTLDSAGGTFDIAGTTHQLTIPGALVGHGPLEKIGDGTLVLSTAKTYAGAVTVSEGTLRLTAANALADAASLEITERAILEFNAAQTFKNLSIENSATISSTAGSVVALTIAPNGLFDLDGNITGNIGTVTINAGATLQITRALRDSAGSPIVNEASNSFEPDGNGIFQAQNFTFGQNSKIKLDAENLLQTSVTGSITFDANNGSNKIAVELEWAAPASKFVIATTNTFISDAGTDTGNILNALKVTIGVPGSVKANVPAEPDLTNPLVQSLAIQSNGTLSELVINTTLRWDAATKMHGTFYVGNLDVNGDGVADAGNPDSLIIGPGGLSSTVGINGMLTDNTGALVSANQPLDSWLGSTLTKTGEGILILSGPNDYSGDTYINAGTLRLQDANSTGGVAGGNSAGTNATIHIEATLELDIGKTNGVTSSSHVFAKTLTGSRGEIIKNNDATLSLTATNSFQGNFTINEGTLALRDAGSLNSWDEMDGTLVGIAKLSINEYASFDITAATTGNAASSLDTDGAPDARLVNIVSTAETATIILGNKRLDIGFDNTAYGSGDFAGKISGSTNSILRKTGGGKLILSGNNSESFYGTLALAGGDLELVGEYAVGNATLAKVLHTSDGSLILADAARIPNAIIFDTTGERRISVADVIDAPGTAGTASFTGSLSSIATAANPVSSGIVFKGHGHLVIENVDAFDDYFGAITIGDGALDSAGTLEIRTNTFDLPLRGTGTLLVSIEEGQLFSFADRIPSVGSTTGFGSVAAALTGDLFQGTIALPKGLIQINDDTAAVLSDGKATLRLGNGTPVSDGSTAAPAVAIVGDATSNGVSLSIGNLTLDGAQVNFTAAPFTPGVVLQTNVLKIEARSKITITGLVGTLTPAPTAPDILAQNIFDLPSTHIQTLISAKQFYGAGNIAWDPADVSSPTKQTRQIDDSHGVATFDYKVIAVPHHPGSTDGTPYNADQSLGGAVGIGIGYGLVAIEARPNATVSLNAASATNNVLRAQLTGTGSFHFTGSVGQEVSVGYLNSLAPSNYTGDTTVSKITLTILDANALGARADLNLIENATLKLGPDGELPLAINRISGEAGTTLLSNTELTIAEGTFPGDIAGDGNLIKDGNSNGNSLVSALTLSGENSYSGKTTVREGKLALSGDGSIEKSERLILEQGTELDISAHSGPAIIKCIETAAAGNDAAAAEIKLGSATLQIGTNSTEDDGDGVIAGLILGTGTLLKTGTGTLTLSGANTFTGIGGTGTNNLGLRFEAGNLILANNTAAGTTASVVTHASAGNLEVLAGLTIANNFLIDLGDTRTFLVSHAEDSDGKTLKATFTGTIADDPLGSYGVGLLVKDGDGELLLSRADALAGFSAPIDLAGGVLEITGGSFVNQLSGTATLRVSRPLTGSLPATANNSFTFGEFVGSEFRGTLEIATGAIQLGTNESAVLGRASLVLKPAGVADISAETSLNGYGSVTLDGGALRFQADTGRFDTTGHLTVTKFDVSAAGGSISVNLNAALSGDVSESSKIIFGLWEEEMMKGDNTRFQLLAVTGPQDIPDYVVFSTVADTPHALRLVNHDGEPLDVEPTKRPLNQHGTQVAALTLGYALDVVHSVNAEDDPTKRGVYIKNTLVEIEALANRTVELDASSSTTPKITALLSGSGNFSFIAATGQEIVINPGTPGTHIDESGEILRDIDGIPIIFFNPYPNTYTGKTTANANLRLEQTAALGETSALTIIGNHTVQLLAGVEQFVGELNAESQLAVVLLDSKDTVLTAASGLFAGKITGAGDLVKSGAYGPASILTLSGENNFTGNITIEDGTLEVSGAIGARTSATPVFTGEIKLAKSTAVLLLDREGDLTLSGEISGAGKVERTGAGIFTLEGENSYGATTIRDGATLALISDANLGNGTNTLKDATLLINGRNGATFTSAWTLEGNAVIKTESGHDAIFASNLSGSGSLEKTGAGTLTLAGVSHTFSGGVIISAGTLVVNDEAFIGTGTNNHVFNGGSLKLGSGDFKNTWSVAANSSLETPSGTRVNWAGNILASAAASDALLTKTGTGTFFVASSATITANFAVAAGTLAGTGTLEHVSFTPGTDVTISPGPADNTPGSITFGSAAAAGISQDGIAIAPIAVNGVTIRLDLGHVDQVAAGEPLPLGESDSLIFAGNTAFGTEGLRNTLNLVTAAQDLGSWNDGYYVIAQTASADAVLTTGDLDGTIIKRDGITLTAGSRIRAVIELENQKDAAGNDTGISQLVLYTYSDSALRLTWNGSSTDSNWSGSSSSSSAPANWLEADGSMLGTGRTFESGDIAYFAPSGSGKNIFVTGAGGGVIVGGMEVAGEGYVFGGGSIVGLDTGKRGHNITADGKLLIAANASATFNSAVQFNAIEVHGDTTFAGGITLTGAAGTGDFVVAAGTTATITLSATEKFIATNTNAPAKIAVAGTLLFKNTKTDLAIEITGGGTVEITELSANGADIGSYVNLRGKNTFTGGLSITGGKANIVSNDNLGAGSVTLDGGALEFAASITLPASRNLTVGSRGATFTTVDETIAVSVAGTLTGSGSFTKTGDGKISLTGAAKYTGQTIVNAGELVIGGSLGINADTLYPQLTKPVFLYTETLSVADGATLTFAQPAPVADAAGNLTGVGSQVIAGNLTGTGDFVKDGVQTLVLGGGSNAIKSFTNSGAGETAVTGSLTVEVLNNAAGSRFDISAGAGTLAVTTLDNAGDFSAGVINVADNGSFKNAATGTVLVEALTTLGNGALIENAGSFVAKKTVLDSEGVETTTLQNITGGGIKNTVTGEGDSQKVPVFTAGIVTAGPLGIANEGEFNITRLTTEGSFENTGTNANARIAGDAAVSGAFKNDGGAKLSAASLTTSGSFENGENSTIEVGELTATGAGIINAGSIKVIGAFTGNVGVGTPADGDAFANTGSIEAAIIVGDIANNGSTGTITVGTVTGSIRGNAGVIKLGSGGVGGDIIVNGGGDFHITARGQTTVGGRVLNDGWIFFESFGAILGASGLANSTDDGIGYHSVEVDFEDVNNADHYKIPADAIVNGRHVFVVRNYQGKVARDTRVPLVVGGRLDPSAEVSAVQQEADNSTHAIEVGFYKLGVGSGADNAVELYVTGLRADAGAALNVTGLLPTGWFADLDNATRHFAETRAAAFDSKGRGFPNEFWVRGYAEQLNADLGVFGSGKTRQNQYGGAVGYDHAIGNPGGGAFFAGLYAGYQTSKITFRDGTGAKGDSDAISAAAYGHWLHANGWFFNGAIKGQFFESEVKSASNKGEFDTAALGFSFAFGKQFDLGKAWFIEPEIRLDYVRLIGDEYTLGTGQISTADTDLFRGSVTARAGTTFVIGPTLLRPYVRLGAEHQISSGGQITAEQERLRPNTDGTRAILGTGISWQFGHAHQLTLGYEAAFGSKYEKVWSISAGYSIRF